MCANLNTMLGDFPFVLDSCPKCKTLLHESDKGETYCPNCAWDTEEAFMPKSPLAPVDRVTFNYGRALGRPKHDPLFDGLVEPWNRDDIAAQFDAMEAFAHSMGAIGLQFTHASWAMDMALRDIRCSETREEQAAAFETARALYARLDRGLERPAAGGIKYFRYGRIGEVLRNFVYGRKA